MARVATCTPSWGGVRVTVREDGVVVGLLEAGSVGWQSDGYTVQLTTPTWAIWVDSVILRSGVVRDAERIVYVGRDVTPVTDTISPRGE